MELILQCKHFEFENKIKTSTTRFANVAFSNGSLLQSFPIRFEKREPIPAPLEIKDFLYLIRKPPKFVSYLAAISQREIYWFQKLMIHSSYIQ